MRVLITGFEPFSGYSSNSSWEVAKEVASYAVNGVELVAEQIPVSFARSSEVLRDKVEQHTPDILILLGQAATSDCIRLERVALNIMDAANADNDGFKPDEEPINKDGAAALFTTLPIKKLRRAIEAEGAKVEVSNSAGLYVCNRLYYTALEICREQGAMQALFIHLPLCEGQPTNKPTEYTMPLATMARAVRRIIEESYEQSYKI